jgi:hypothetical protein
VAQSGFVIAKCENEGAEYEPPVELLYPDSAHVRAAFAGRKPDCANCCGLNSVIGASTVTSVNPIKAMAAPGRGSRTKPTIAPAKIEK